MWRCECSARLGRGWRFCESCGRPVAQSEAETHPLQVALPAPLDSPEAKAVGLNPAMGLADQSQAMASDTSSPTPTPAAAALKAPAVLIGHFDWRFLLAPILIGFVLGLFVVWLSPWILLLTVALGAVWGGRRWLAVQSAMRDFENEWVFDKVVAYGACALGARAWWPSGILYLTDQTLKFKPFNHTNEREVSLDPARLTGFDFPENFSWPADWRCFLVASNYGPVFGTMKVFDRVVWEQTLKEAKIKACSNPVSELP